MMSARRLLAPVAAALIALCAVAAFGQSLGTSGLDWQTRFLGILPLVKPNPTDPIIASVNGASVTLAQIDSYAKAEKQLINATSTQETRAVWQDAADNLVNRTLLLQEAQKRKITIPEGEVAVRARKFQLQGGSDTTNGAPDQQLLDEVREAMEIEAMLDGVFKAEHVTPTSAQMEKYYHDHQDLFVKDPGEVRISHIAVRIPEGATDAQKDAALRKIKDLYEQAEKGADFAQLAGKTSEDSRSAQKGGDLGYFRPGQLPPVVEKQAFQTKVGGVSEIIASNIGYSFMKVTDRRDAAYAPYKEVKQKIAEVLLNYNQEDAVKDLLRKLRKTAKIEFRQPPNRQNVPGGGTS